MRVILTLKHYFKFYLTKEKWNWNKIEVITEYGMFLHHKKYFLKDYS